MKKLAVYIILVWIYGSVFIGCKKETTDNITDLSSPSYLNLSFGIDKSIYNPGDLVTFRLDNNTIPASAMVRYKYLDNIIEEESLSGSTWSWTSPTEDFRGYIVEVYSVSNGVETIYATTAVDVSSEWTKFPRYGFLSKFPQLNNTEMDNIVSNLNKYHINGIQFYDWHNKHHMPLPMNGNNPASTWKDIINRDISFSTVEKYITKAHSYNMKAMFYNLVYGAWNNAEADGVKPEWYIYTNNTHSNKDYHPLSAPFLSNLYILDPSNTEWQQYIIAENAKVYQFLDFDGFHMDQLGSRGSRYLYNGTSIDLSATYKPFINAVKESNSEKYNVMNAVNQYGQQGIAEASSDFLYTEVWSPNNSYNDLANLIKQNNSLGNEQKNTVLAAYVNYNLADNTGYFNKASVLLTNAVIFSFGGAHLELGEHMLGKEYFPNNNLSMKSDLKTALVDYYDFLVAYQNLLRDGGIFNNVSIASLDSKMLISSWPSSQGRVASFGKFVNNYQVIHFINFSNSTTQNWRDDGGIQVEPTKIVNSELGFSASGPVKKIWVASPDVMGGASFRLDFEQNNDYVTFVLPELKYWSMVVVEYQ